MAFCSQCGGSISSKMRFCPNCGAALTVQYQQNHTPVTQEPYLNSEICDFSIILLHLGTCRLSDAICLMEDILGYNAMDARALVKTAPVEISRNLTLAQAQYLAQALTEYGMDVSITNADCSQVHSSGSKFQSVFDSTGKFLPAVAATLGLLGLSNRVSRITRWSSMVPPPPPFRLENRRPMPLRHFRRTPLHRTILTPPGSGRPMQPPIAKPVPRPSRPRGMDGNPGSFGRPRRGPGGRR